MIEIIILIFLCRTNYKNAVARGKNGVLFVILTLALWVVLEIIGVNLGLDASYNQDLMTAMLYGLGFAAVGAIISYVWAKAGPVLEAKAKDENEEENKDDTDNNIIV